ILRAFFCAPSIFFSILRRPPPPPPFPYTTLFRSHPPQPEQRQVPQARPAEHHPAEHRHRHHGPGAVLVGHPAASGPPGGPVGRTSAHRPSFRLRASIPTCRDRWTWDVRPGVGAEVTVPRLRHGRAHGVPARGLPVLPSSLR